MPCILVLAVIAVVLPVCLLSVACVLEATPRMLITPADLIVHSYAAGAERMKLRLERASGANPSLVTEEEVLYIIQTCQKGHVEFIARLGAASDGPSSIQLAAILTGLAHCWHGKWCIELLHSVHCFVCSVLAVQLAQ